MEGDDDEEEDADDLDNEINYGQGNNSKAGMQWEEDGDFSSSSGHDSQIPNPHLANGQPVMFLADSDISQLGLNSSVAAKMCELVNALLVEVMHTQTQLLRVGQA